MKARQLKNRQKAKGFTIIEVLIVLAIAGLILLIVFLAVPALQRNSRNTSRRADVSAILAAVNEYVANSTGTLPTGANWTAAPNLTLTGSTQAQAKLGFYTSGIGTGSGQVFYQNPFAATAALPGNAANDRVIVVNGAQCNGAAAAAGSARQVALLYEIETGSGVFTATCTDS